MSIKSMVKKNIFAYYTLSIIRYFSLVNKKIWVKFYNKIFGVHSIDLGGGDFSVNYGWWTGDSRDNFIIDSKTVFPFKDNSLDLVYSSMLFEHLDLVTAKRVINEAYRILKNGATLRIVIPDFDFYIQRYFDNDEKFFRQIVNTETWFNNEVPITLENLLLASICSVHSHDHELVFSPFLIDVDCVRPKVMRPVSRYIYDYYSGPVKELVNIDVKGQLKQMGNESFLDWVFKVSANSEMVSGRFNEWHKSAWHGETLSALLKECGFSSVHWDKYDEKSFPKNVEYKKHKKYARYICAYK